MATITELNDYIDQINKAIIKVSTGGSIVILDILGVRQQITRANIKDMIKTKEHFEAEVRRLGRPDGRRAKQVI